MTSTPAQARAGFVELLAAPLLTAARHPAAYSHVARHRYAVTDLAARFGYQVRVVGAAIRLERMPLAGTVAHPPTPLAAPTRRVFALACLVAAACEDTDGAVTLAGLSAGVTALSASHGVAVAAYDPDNQAHRRQLVHAVTLLESHGVLTLRTGADAIDSWRESRTGAGAGYQVDRDALLLIANPDVLARSVAVPDPGDRDASRQIRLQRILLETPALLYADLADIDPGDAERARATRGLLKGPVTLATGGHVEDRAEGMVLIVGDDASPSPLRLDFPAARADSWAALLAVDTLGQTGTRDSDGRVHVSDDQIEQALDELVEDRGRYLSVPLRDSRAALRAAIERTLSAVGLIRVGADGWVIAPVAGRYRAPEVRVSAAPDGDEANA
jgi:uncharacterized protein (TIGR02678 family)